MGFRARNPRIFGNRVLQDIFSEKEVRRSVGKENALPDDRLEPGIGGIHSFVPVKGGKMADEEKEKKVKEDPG
jgi:hypothetical protein